jgi:hypothetical protein
MWTALRMMINVAGAFRFCGLRSVVGTLGVMSHEGGPSFAEEFYRYMLRDPELNVYFKDYAGALNRATREMRG